MKMIAVQSSNIAEVGYSDKRKTLRVKFTNGREYEFYPVDKENFKLLRDAESVGKYFNEHIKANPSITAVKM